MYSTRCTHHRFSHDFTYSTATARDKYYLSFEDVVLEYISRVHDRCNIGRRQHRVESSRLFTLLHGYRALGISARWSEPDLVSNRKMTNTLAVLHLVSMLSLVKTLQQLVAFVLGR